MCQSHLLTYTCTHTLPIRLSTCRGSFTTTPNPRKPPKPACSGAVTLVLASASACGDCQRRDAEAELEAVGTVMDGAEEGQWDLGKEMFALGRRFPSCKRFRSWSSQKVDRRRGGLGAEMGGGEDKCKKVERQRGSLLRREVLPEEVVVRSSEWKTLVGNGWDRGDWGDYKSLSDELEENAAAAAAEEDDWTSQSMDLPMTSAMGESMDDYCAAFHTDETVTIEDNNQDDECGTSWSPDWSSEASWETTESSWSLNGTTDGSEPHALQSEQTSPESDEHPVPPTPAAREDDIDITPKSSEQPFRLPPMNSQPITTTAITATTEHLTPHLLSRIPTSPLRSTVVYSVLTLPTRGSKTPCAPSAPIPHFRCRRSSLESICNGNTAAGRELELWERLQLFIALPPVVVCGGRGGDVCEW